mgnify:FL=1|jgi:hypothetical protein|tara:strand:+ start:194 stop:385 length:192 start_codon:yes stop_codon:yes gene_type:complete
MTNREIDYGKLLQNIDEMINTLEYDSSRSGGKTKLNCDKLYYLYSLQQRYNSLLKPKKEVTKK